MDNQINKKQNSGNIPLGLKYVKVVVSKEESKSGASTLSTNVGTSTTPNQASKRNASQQVFNRQELLVGMSPSEAI